MRKRLLSIILFGIALRGYSQTEEANAKKSTRHYTTAKFDCVIFPADYDGTPNNKVFTPTIDQVNLAEKAMTKQLKDAPTRHPSEMKFVVKHLADYKRQYFGYIDHKGHHILYINCFMSQDGEDGKTMPLIGYRKKLRQAIAMLTTGKPPSTWMKDNL